MTGETYTDEQVVAAMQHCSTTTRLENLITQAREMVEGTTRLTEADPDLKPEVLTVLAGLNEIVGALSRAHDFSKARVDVKLGHVL